MATPEIHDALEQIAKAWHVLTGAAEAIAPEVRALTPLASKVMGLAAAGNPLTEASEAALSVLVDVFKAAESHNALAPPPRPANQTSVSGGSLPIEAQAAAAVSAAGSSQSDATAPAPAPEPDAPAEAPAAA